MSDIRSLDSARKKRRKADAQGKTLCRSGHHKWLIDKRTTFDSKSGKLVTRSICERCGKSKVKGT